MHSPEPFVDSIEGDEVGLVEQDLFTSFGQLDPLLVEIFTVCEIRRLPER